MVNNSININKTNNHLSLQLTEHKKDHDMWLWKSRSWDSHKHVGVKPINGISTLPSW